MKPLLSLVAAVCLIITIQAHPDNIEEVKDLPQKVDPVIEAEESDPQKRTERCSTCSVKLNIKSPNNVLAALQAIPGAEVHTQQSFEECSSDKGCAGIKVKDGRVIEKFGNVDAFRAAAEADAGNEFSFHAAGTFGNNVFEAGLPGNGPFWWMNQDSPFKTGGGNFEKVSKSSSTFSTSGTAGAGGQFSGGMDLSANPFLNGGFSGIAAQGVAQGAAQGGKPASSFQASSFESSSFSTNKGEVDLAKNPFLNGGIKIGQGGFQAEGAFGAGQFSSSGSQGAGFSASQGAGSNQAGFGASSGQAGFGAGATQGSLNGGNQGSFSSSSQTTGFSSGSRGTGFGSGQNSGFGSGSGQGSATFGAQGSFGQGSKFGASGFGSTGSGASQGANTAFSSSANKFSSSGYSGSTPRPFTASTAGSNINLIQNTQKSSEFDFEQQQQTQNIDEAFQSTGNVNSQHNDGVLQQTCAGQGYVCVHKAQCNNGVVNSNGAAILQAKTSKQYCNIKTEICCRIELSNLGGAAGQDLLGVGLATFQGSNSQGNLFATSQNSGQGSSNGFGTTQSGSGQGTSNSFGSSQSGSFGAQGFGSSSFGSKETQNTQSQNSGQFGSTGQFGSNSGQFGSGTKFGSSSGQFGATGQFGSTSGQRGSTSGVSTFGSTAGSVNRGTTASGFESQGSFGTSSNKFGATGTFGNGFSTVAPNKFGSTAGFNEVYKSTSQSNFIETDSFSAGSENAGVYRPGAIGSNLKPGIPYLPPVDSSTQASNVISSTAYVTSRPVTTPRPTTAKPTYLPPPPSTSAPTYLPPDQYNEGSLILNERRTTARPPISGPPANDFPAGCAAALKCTPIEYCTADGIISNTTVVLSRDQEAYRVPLTDCKDIESGRVGKCCRDPLYTDPWPTNQLGRWVPGVFGGNDGKYVPDNKGSSNNPRPQVTGRPPVTGGVNLNILREPSPTPYGPNQVTPGYPSTSVTKSYASQSKFGVSSQGQFGVGGQGQFASGGQGQYSSGGQGQYSSGGQGQYASGGQGQFASGGRGQITSGGQGQYSSGGQGQFAVGGRGQIASGGQGQYVSRGQGQFGAAGQQTQQTQSSQVSSTATQFNQNEIQNQNTKTGQGVISGGGQSVSFTGGQGVEQGQGSYSTGGRGQFEISGQTIQSQFNKVQGQKSGFEVGVGQAVSSESGIGVQRGTGFAVKQGQGFGVESQITENIYRVFLQRYSGSGQCGVLNPQNPYGNRNDLEVDFAEIPWQAMVLLQTNRSLLCGGVITRPDVVVTSAACVDGLDAKNVLIKGGEWKLGIDDEPLPFQIVQVKHILRHPFYRRGSLENDAAILVLTENLRLANNIYPICLPGARDTVDAFYNGAGECIVTGWGKQVLQAHLAGSIMHSVNVSLINPGECQAKLSQDYPHLLEQYNQDSCVCGQPTNPTNNICRVDIGSALACTTGDGHFTLRGVYSWDSGCQLGNQLAAFYKFDLEWYEWALGLLESARFAQFAQGGSQVSQNRFSGQITSGVKGSQFGGKGSQFGGVKGGSSSFGSSQYSVSGQKSSQSVLGGQGQLSGSSGQFGRGEKFSGGQFTQFSEASGSGGSGLNFGAQLKGPVSNSFTATYSEKKVFQSEPKIFTYTTKPEIVTFTTKPEYFTYTTKPKIISYTTKPQVITYETSGSDTNSQYVAPSLSFSEAIKGHQHNAQCKCLQNGKK